MTRSRNPFPLEDVAAFRAWKGQNPNAEKLLFRIIFRWRVSNARHRELPGRWVANPIDFWAEDAKLSRDQTKRALRDLEVDGLVVRARGWFAGSKVHTYLQPTPLALKYMGKPNDIDRLEQSFAVSKKSKPAPTPAPIAAPTPAPTVAPIAAPTITNPSIPSKPSNLASPSNAHAHASAKGKEGFGEKTKKKLVLKKKKSGPEAPIAPPTPQQIDAEIAAAKMQAKEAQAKKRLPLLLKKFPIWEGPHRKGPKPVRHPYEMHGWKWATWSPALIVEKYVLYEEYVANWYVGKQGKPYKPFSDEDAEYDLDTDYPDIEEELKAYQAQKAAKSGTVKPIEKN